jgi:hypothetical protein
MLRKLTICLTLLLLVCLAGCKSPLATIPTSTRSGSNPTLSNNQPAGSPQITQIIAEQARVMRDVTSCQITEHLEMDLKSSDNSQGRILITADMRSEIDSLKRLMSSTVTTNFSLGGRNQKLQRQIVASGDTIYYKDGADGQWQKKSLNAVDEAALWNEQDQQFNASRYTEVISPDQYSYSGKGKSGQYACYIFKRNLDPQQLADLAPDLLAQIESSQAALPEDLAGMLQNIEIVCLIDVQDYYLREVDISAGVNQSYNGKTVTGTVRQSFRYEAFNQAVSVQIPEIN